jgi:hypothetical protein
MQRTENSQRVRLPDSLRPQDVLLACKVFSLGLTRSECTYASLGAALGISTSTSFEAATRCRQSQLLPPSGWLVSPRHLRDLLVVGVPRIFYAVRGGLVCGTTTATCAAPVASKFKPPSEGSLPVVWCEDDAPESLPRGEGLEPIYPTVPAAARQDIVVYELLALADVMRIGTTVERTIAVGLIDKRLGSRP